MHVCTVYAAAFTNREKITIINKVHIANTYTVHIFDCRNFLRGIAQPALEKKNNSVPVTGSLF
jgi:hypothetical protein